jgi:hypothetical protein
MTRGGGSGSDEGKETGNVEIITWMLQDESSLAHSIQEISELVVVIHGEFAICVEHHEEVVRHHGAFRKRSADRALAIHAEQSLARQMVHHKRDHHSDQ